MKYFTLERIVKAQVGNRGIAVLSLLTSALDGGGVRELSAPHFGRFTFGKETGIHCIGGWVGHRAGRDG